MHYELKRFSAEQFGDIADRKQRLQAGEERLVELFFDDANQGVFCEVGANDPKLYSQTWHLEAKGWQGVLIEPIPELCERLRAHRAGSQIFQAACGRPEDVGQADFHVAKALGKSTLVPDESTLGLQWDRVEKVAIRTLDEILQNAGVDRLDFISIDVEGAQMQVLGGFSFQRFRPRLLLMEDHLHNLKVHRHIQRQGYELVKRTNLNNWYVPRGSGCAVRSPGEMLKLRLKLARTPIRGLQYSIKRLLKNKTNA